VPFLERLRDRIADVRSGRREAPFSRIDCDDTSVRVSRYGRWKRSQTSTTSAFLWADVTAIHAFKRDLLVVDRVCLAFQAGLTTPIEVDEDMEGYRPFLDQVIRRFAGFDRQKLDDIVMPPFAPGFTTLWKLDRSLPWTDEHLAAALELSLRVGLFSMDETAAILDHEIQARDTPPGWMLDATLASARSARLELLRPAAEGHPMWSDELSLLDAASRRPGGDEALMSHATMFAFNGESQIPSEIAAVVYDLELAEAMAADGWAHSKKRFERERTEACARLRSLVKGQSRFAYALDRLEQMAGGRPTPSP